MLINKVVACNLRKLQTVQASYMLLLDEHFSFCKIRQKKKKKKKKKITIRPAFACYLAMFDCNYCCSIKQIWGLIKMCTACY